MKTGEEFVLNTGSKLAADAVGNQWNQKSVVGSDYVNTNVAICIGLEDIGTDLYEVFPNIHMRDQN